MNARPFVTQADTSSAHVSIRSLAEVAPLAVSSDAPPLAIVAALEARLCRLGATLMAINGEDADSTVTAIAEAMTPGVDECVILCEALTGALEPDSREDDQ